MYGSQVAIWSLIKLIAKESTLVVTLRNTEAIIVFRYID